MDVNYSNRTIAEKLGIEPGMTIVVINKPDEYEQLIEEVADKVQIVSMVLENEPFIHYFAHTRNELAAMFPKLKRALAKDGSLWISNPKNSNGFSQNDVMEIGLKNGLVDIKIASLGDEWSAMKFMYRIQDR